ncbi:MAG: hypothetical protein CL581_12760 [Alteromonadaceae bacterium]|nr:hypothetical protein [Alteromonadaceae bacterium]
MLGFTSNQLMGSTPVFCVEFEWGGRVHRYATHNITLQSNGGPLHYLPSIMEFDFLESADLTSINVEANIVSMGLIMDDVDLLERWSQGDTIEGLDAEFFYVLMRYDVAQQDFEDRVVLYRGQIQEPQFGDPNQFHQFVSISIEAQPYDSNRLLMDSNKYIDTRFTNRHIDTSDGKIFPIILGSAGGLIRTTVGTTKNIHALPSYCVNEYDAAKGVDARFMVAGHPITATSAVIQDDKYDTDTKTIQFDDDGRGNIYAYIELDTSDDVAIPGSTVNGESREWWVYMTGGGGLVNPFGEGDLQGAGDICRWALQRSGQIIDDGAWANLAPILNQYNFEGYINDPKITAWSWLNGNILPFLPITVRMGPNGLRPILIQLWALTHVTSMASITVDDDSNVTQVSPINTIRSTSQLMNQFTLRWGKRGFDQEYTSMVRVTNIKSEDYDVVSDYSILSVNRYGVKPMAMDSDYIYDRDTAIKVSMDMVRSKCLPINTIEVDVDMELGWLQVGDVLDVTAPKIYLTTHKMIIISKRWRGTHWRWELAFEMNPRQ